LYFTFTSDFGYFFSFFLKVVLKIKSDLRPIIFVLLQSNELLARICKGGRLIQLFWRLLKLPLNYVFSKVRFQAVPEVISGFIHPMDVIDFFVSVQVLCLFAIFRDKKLISRKFDLSEIFENNAFIIDQNI